MKNDSKYLRMQVVGIFYFTFFFGYSDHFDERLRNLEFTFTQPKSFITIYTNKRNLEMGFVFSEKFVTNYVNLCRTFILSLYKY